jgi:CheY-like chemotaxis protein
MCHHRVQSTKQPASEALSSLTSPGRILLGEDDDQMRSLLAGELHREGYEVVECRNGVQLLDRLYSFLLPHGREDYHLIISDIRMPGLTGLEILAGLADKPGFPPTILITAFGDDETHAEAERYHVVAVFDKPFDIEDLLAKVRETVPPPEQKEE